MGYHCFSCNKNLDGHPKIKVKGNINCFACAKRIVAALDFHTEAKHTREVKAHDAEYEKWKKWNERREAGLPTINAQAVVTCGVAAGCAFLLANPIFFLLPGLVVGVIANQLYYNSAKKSWLRRNREPVLPTYPSNIFIRDQIELVGETSGTPLGTGYRKIILERDGHQCQTCGRLFRVDQLEVHYVRPQAKGGKHYAANLVTLCFHCHVEDIWFGHSHKKRRFIA